MISSAPRIWDQIRPDDPKQGVLQPSMALDQLSRDAIERSDFQELKRQFLIVVLNIHKDRS